MLSWSGVRENANGLCHWMINVSWLGSGDALFYKWGLLTDNSSEGVGTLIASEATVIFIPNFTSKDSIR